MNCHEVQTRLVEAVYGELPPALETPFQEHLAGCAECRLALTELANADKMLEALPDAVARVDIPRLYRMAIAGSRRRGRRWRRAAVAAAGLLVVVGGLAIWRGRIEVGPNRFVISWRAEHRQPAPPPAATLDARLAAHAKHLATLDESIGLLVAELDAQEQDRMESMRSLREQIRGLQQRNNTRMDLVQQDLRALYLASVVPESEEIGEQP